MNLLEVVDFLSVQYRLIPKILEAYHSIRRQYTVLLLRSSSPDGIFKIISLTSPLHRKGINFHTINGHLIYRLYTNPSRLPRTTAPVYTQHLLF